MVTSGNQARSFSLATCRVGGAPTAVVVVDGGHHPLVELVPELSVSPGASGLMQLFGRWGAVEPVIVAAVDELRAGTRTCRDVGAPAEIADWLSPLQYPAKVICTGANYYEHVTKDGGHASFSKDDNIPVFFLKPPTTTLVGQGAVRAPAQTEKLDYEIELAFVIGEGGRNIAMEQARRHVAGYTVAIDLSARDWQRHPKHLVKFDLFGGKAFDESCPLGPGIVPARYVDPGALRLRLSVNGELRQDASTADMIWPVDELIVRISDHVTLEPGDVVLTGTPSGVGLATGTWLGVGDVIDCEISGLGSMRVEIGSPDS
jgi:2-keto-4-pentenoate hydratase/2-oxohepta-3-ene-1,7-dioic acid hydratase in catechol pathway